MSKKTSFIAAAVISGIVITAFIAVAVDAHHRPRLRIEGMPDELFLNSDTAWVTRVVDGRLPEDEKAHLHVWFSTPCGEQVLSEDRDGPSGPKAYKAIGGASDHGGCRYGTSSKRGTTGVAWYLKVRPTTASSRSITIGAYQVEDDD